MRVLIACEFSGVVRDAFRARGHYAKSCDILPSEKRGPHYQGDILDILEGAALGEPWDLIIAHPPCTYLANSGAKHLYKGMRKENGPDPDRWQRMREACTFFCRLWNTSCPCVAIENPIMHGHARMLINLWPSQTIQPWQFGHGETKATQLYLRGLPLLRSTNLVSGREPKVHFASPGPNRWKNRSRTLPGIAAAMAEQWEVVAPGPGSIETDGEKE